MVPPTASFTTFPAPVAAGTPAPKKQVATMASNLALEGREEYDDEYVFADIKEHQTARAMTSR